MALRLASAALLRSPAAASTRILRRASTNSQIVIAPRSTTSPAHTSARRSRSATTMAVSAVPAAEVAAPAELPRYGSAGQQYYNPF
jgi:hypothetical protein